MAELIDMSLDDIIKKSKGDRRRYSSGGAAGRPGAARGKRRGSTGSGGSRALIVARNGPRRSLDGGGPDRKKSPFGGKRRSLDEAFGGKRRSLDEGRRQVDGGPRRGGLATESGPGRLVVSNLDYAVSDSDIVELFSEFGLLRSSSVHYDKNGRSLGSADIVFKRKSDAVKAMKQYNGVPLDGKKMKIMIATSDVAAIVQTPRAFIPKNRNGRVDKSPRARRWSGGDKPQRGGGGSPPGKAGRGSPGWAKVKKEPAPTKEELDMELDSYNQFR